MKTPKKYNFQTCKMFKVKIIFVCSVFIFSYCAFSSENNLKEILETPFEKVVVLKTKKEPISAEKVKLADQHAEIVDGKGKLILCKITEIDEICLVLPETTENQKPEDIEKALKTFPKDGSILLNDSRFSMQKYDYWKTYLNEKIEKEKKSAELKKQAEQELEQRRAAEEQARRSSKILEMEQNLPKKLRRIFEIWDGHPDTVSFYDPDKDPELAKDDHNRIVGMYLSLKNRKAHCDSIAGSLAFQILAYLKLRYPEKWSEMIVDSNTPWKGSLSMQEVMEIFNSFLNSMESRKVEKQNRLEERKRQSTQF